MSSLARYFSLLGKKVSGYDLTPTPLTAKLENEGIEITFTDMIQSVPAEFLDENSMGSTLVVYTPAIPGDNKIFRYFTSRGYKVLKRSKLLGELVNDAKGIAVAGTHGKTSVSALTAHLLKQTSLGCTAFLGGVAKNYDSNLLVDSKSDLVVTEADEYDRSFLQLFPFIAVITSMDPDHLDVYGSFSKMKEAYSSFAGQIKEGGTLICRKGLEAGINMKNKVRVLSYGIDVKADYYASNLRIALNGIPVFDLVTPDGHYTGLELGIAGRFNIENAVAAIAAAMICGAGEQEIRRGLKSFTGVKRRFEIIINDPDCILIDDYAHHPAELKACISAVREIFPGRKITGIFQPHLYSRTRDFADEFAASLDALDELLLLDIYPARELPVPGVSSDLIFKKLKLENKTMCSREQLPGIIRGLPTDIVITLGAGNVDAMVEPVRNILMEKKKRGL
jgi:UDP-N-acetylmuramate--alanine ligase